MNGRNGCASIERLFELKKNGTTVRMEIIAGITTFITMAYILAVCPNIMAQAGAPTTTTYIESESGILAGGRTGLASVVTAMAFTYSVSDGIMWGVIGHAGIHLLAGRGREVHWVVYVLSVLFITKYALL